MIKKPATIRDVAKASGVSAATVSYVMNNGPRRVEPATKERVLASIERLQYHPNGVARGLSRKRMDCIGIVFPEPDKRLVADSYFSAILDGVVEAATDHKQNVMLYTGFRWEGRVSLPALCDSRVDGLVLIAADADSDIVSALASAGRPFVLVSDTRDDPQVSSVDIDNIDAVRQVVDHFVELGHRRIGFLSGEEKSPSTRPRCEGFFKAITAHGLDIDPELHVQGFYSRDWGRVGMDQLLSLRNPPTAVFAGGDGIALGAYDACAAAGIAVPDQISIVGFDDAPYAKDAQPPLTTVRHPLTEIGVKAASLLIGRILNVDGESHHASQIIMPAKLIVRNSTSAPAGSRR